MSTYGGHLHTPAWSQKGEVEATATHWAASGLAAERLVDEPTLARSWDHSYILAAELAHRALQLHIHMLAAAAAVVVAAVAVAAAAVAVAAAVAAAAVAAAVAAATAVAEAAAVFGAPAYICTVGVAAVAAVAAAVAAVAAGRQ